MEHIDKVINVVNRRNRIAETIVTRDEIYNKHKENELLKEVEKYKMMTFTASALCAFIFLCFMVLPWK